MKQTNKNQSSLVVATLVLGTVFMLSVVYQNWTVEEIIQEHVALNDEASADKNISIDELSDELELNVEVVYSFEDINEPVELSFSEAFTLAHEKLGPGCTFVWNDNQYTTNRADDDQVDESDKYVLDTTSEQSTDGQSITIAP